MALLPRNPAALLDRADTVLRGREPCGRKDRPRQVPDTAVRVPDIYAADARD